MKYLSRTIIILFFLSLIPRLILLGLFIDRGVYDSWRFDYGDGIYYTQVAKNIIDYGTVSIDQNDPPIPDSLRTPLYSIFLIPFIYFNAPLWVPALAQDILVSLFTVIFFLAIRRLFGGRIAFISAVLLALEPYWIFLSNRIIAEPLFVPLFIAGFLFCLYFLIIQDRPAYIYGAAASFALAALTRPVALYFFVFVPLLCLWRWRRSVGLLAVLRRTAIACFIFFAILEPWFMRNRITLNSWSISSVQEYNLFQFIGKPFCAWLGDRCDKEFLEAANVLPEAFDQRYAREYKTAGIKLISRHPLSYAFFALQAVPHLFFDNAYVDILQIMSDKPLYTTQGLTRAILDFDLGAITAYLRERGTLILAVVFFGKAFLILLFIGALSAARFLFRKDVYARSSLAVMFLGICLYAVLSSPIGSPRLRTPIYPLLAVLASLGVMWHYGEYSYENEPGQGVGSSMVSAKSFFKDDTRR